MCCVLFKKTKERKNMSNAKEIFEILSNDKLTVRDLLSVQYKASERTIPSDIIDNEYEKHPSESKNENIDILDMDLTHLVRSYSKCLRNKRISNDESTSKIVDLLNDIDKSVHKIRTTI